MEVGDGVLDNARRAGDGGGGSLKADSSGVVARNEGFGAGSNDAWKSFELSAKSRSFQDDVKGGRHKGRWRPFVWGWSENVSVLRAKGCRYNCKCLRHSVLIGAADPRGCLQD